MRRRCTNLICSNTCVWEMWKKGLKKPTLSSRIPAGMKFFPIPCPPEPPGGDRHLGNTGLPDDLHPLPIHCLFPLHRHPVHRHGRHARHQHPMRWQLRHQKRQPDTGGLCRPARQKIPASRSSFTTPRTSISTAIPCAWARA